MILGIILAIFNQIQQRSTITILTKKANKYILQ